MASTREPWLNPRRELMIIFASGLAIVVVILWQAFESDGVGNLDVGDCVSGVPTVSARPEGYPVPLGREMISAGGVAEVSCSDSGAEFRVVGETDGNCETTYAIVVDDTEFCLAEVG